MKTSLLAALFFFVSVIVTQAQSAFHVEVKGKGEPVLLFPGFGCTGKVWNDAVAVLSQSYECHIFTFAGFGDVPPIETPWLPKIKDQVITYVKEKKLNKPTLLGHSLGGTLSLWLASLERDMFKKVIAVDALPASAALMIPNYKGEPIPYDNPRSKMMLDMDSASFLAMSSQSVPYMCNNKEKQKVIIQWMNQADRKTYVYGYLDMLNLDLREDIGKISVPVTILAATSPNLEIVQKTYNTQYAKLPSVVIHYAPNSAHFVMYDQPEWFIQKLNETIR